MIQHIKLIILTILASTSFGQSNFQKYFDSLNVAGSTTIFDYYNKKWIFTDKADAEIVSLPASTFKIPHTLIALENKVVADEYEVYKWDGIPKSHLGKVVDLWNKDTDMNTAFKNSTVWFYEEIAKKIKRKSYKKILENCGYGNSNLNEKGQDFWNYGNFGVTPKNQIEFLIKLYEDKLPFSKYNMDKMKEIMISEKSETHNFRGKTGWTRKNGKEIGWWVGYVETKDNVYFFATRLLKNENDNNPNFTQYRKELTKLILKDIEVQNKQLPYAEIPAEAENYSGVNVASRLIDGLGFRFYWATEGLRDEDLNFKPNSDARTQLETIQHIYEMSEMIKNSVKETVNLPGQSPKLTFKEAREKTLWNLKIASDILKNSSDNDLNRYRLKFKKDEKLIEYPFWNNINGPISDCLWHTGQIVSFRRSSGNPFSDKVNLMKGELKK
ncbi:MAG: class D beta-lactamase [Saprospiraceae bacterium]|nr:class D beta-lactamase [Saprospiraceae bacterium]